MQVAFKRCVPLQPLVHVPHQPGLQQVEQPLDAMTQVSTIALVTTRKMAWWEEQEQALQEVA